MISTRTQVGEIEVEYELFGPQDGEPMVLVTGVFQQLSFWPTPFLDQLTGAGFRVLIHDNRDVGFSTRESRPAPDLEKVLTGDTSEVDYTLSDMAADSAGLTHVLGLGPTHVVGHSMGGMIAQRVATEFPGGVHSLTLFGTRVNDGLSGETDPDFLSTVLTPSSGNEQEDWKNALEGYRLCVLPEHANDDALAAFLQIQVSRPPNPKTQCIAAVIEAQIAGVSSSPSHIENLRALKTPTLVIHGTGDIVIAFDGGEKLAEVTPQARLAAYEGMGHFPLDPKRWTAIASAIIDHARQHRWSLKINRTGPVKFSSRFLSTRRASESTRNGWFLNSIGVEGST
jgi:pimeloyl-ACP methyl ester carboxylesterase